MFKLIVGGLSVVCTVVLLVVNTLLAADFPYIDDFESQPVGFDFPAGSEWDVSVTHDNWMTYQGVFHLDNNPSGGDQAACSDQIGAARAVMNQHIYIPDTSTSPSLNYYYNLLLLKELDKIYVDIHYISASPEGDETELIDRVKSYSRDANTNGYYKWESISLASYIGKEIWVSFAQANELTGPGRVFVLDNFRISQPSTTDTDNDGIPDDVDLFPGGELLPAPEDFYAEVISSSSVELSWTLLDNSYPVSGYRLFRRKEGQSQETVLNDNQLIAPNISYFVDTSIQVDTGYYYRITAVSCEGVEGESVSDGDSQIYTGNNMIQYPLQESFDSVSPVISTVNGWGWEIAEDHGLWESFSGMYHLDTNPGEVEQPYSLLNQNKQRALMEKKIHIPVDSDSPKLSFWYKMNLGGLDDSFFDQTCFWNPFADWDFLVDSLVPDRIYIDIYYMDYIFLIGDVERVDSMVKTFKPSQNTDDYAWNSISLNKYKGTEIKVVFRQEIGIGGTNGVFVLDDFRIGELPGDINGDGIPDVYQIPMHDEMLPYVKNVTATSTEAGPVQISWAPLDTGEYAVSGYRIYRKITGSDADPVAVNPDLVSSGEGQWTDNTIENLKQYDYYVVGISTDLVEGYPSSVVSAGVNVALPQIILQPEDVNATERETVQFSIEVTGAGMTYQWYRNDEAIYEGVSASYTIESIPYDYGGSVFKCEVSNLAGTVPSTPATLTVNRAIPLIDVSPPDKTVTERDPVEFTVSVTGTNLSFQWKHGVLISDTIVYANIENANSETYSIGSTPYDYTGTTFMCEVSNDAGTVQSTPSTLTVKRAKPIIDVHPLSRTVTERDLVTFSVEVTGTNLTYQWQRQDATETQYTDIADAITSSYTVDSTPYDYGGSQFRCIVFNDAEVDPVATSNAATLTVKRAKPIIDVHPLSRIVTERDSVTFSVEVTGTNLTYQWQRQDATETQYTDIADAITSSYTVDSTPYDYGGSQFRCIVFNDAEVDPVARSNAATLTVKRAKPIIDVHPLSRTATERDSVTFSVEVTGTNLSYRWQRQDASETQFSDIADAIASIYTIDPTPYDYGGSQFRCIVFNDAEVDPVATSNAATLTVKRAKPIIDVHPLSQTATERDSVTFSVEVTGTNLSYRWQRQDATETQFTDIAEAISYTVDPTPYNYDGSQFRCIVSNDAEVDPVVTSDPATLTVIQLPPVITDQPVGLDILEGEPAVFSVSVLGSLLSYQWLKNGTPVSGATSDTLSFASTVHDDHGIYACVVSNDAGTFTSSDAFLIVTIDQKPSLTMDGPENQVTTEAFYDINGVLVNASEELVSIVAVSDRYPGQTFTVVVDETGAITSNIPMGSGENVITITVTYSSGELIENTVTVTLEETAVPVIVIESPMNGTTSSSETVNLSGKVYCSQSVEHIRLIHDDTVIFPTESGDGYLFDFGFVRLDEGYNTLIVKAETAYGTVTAQTMVFYTSSPVAQSENPPQIEIYSPLPDRPVTQNDMLTDGGLGYVLVKGLVRGETDIVRVTVNGVDLTNKSDAPETQVTDLVIGKGPSVSFHSAVQLPSGANTLSLAIEAEDESGLTRSLDYTVNIDLAGPAIEMTSPKLVEKTTTYTVTTVPFTLSGTVSDDNLGGFTVNGQNVGVIPDAGNTYKFRADLKLPNDRDTPIIIEAWDMNGQLSSLSFSLNLDATLNVDILSPTENSSFDFSGTTCDVSVYARVPEISDTDFITARIDDQTPVVLTRSGITGSGVVNATVTEGEHTLTVTVQASDNSELAQHSIRLDFINTDNIPVEVTSIIPADKATGVEANQFITINFNREIDPALLDVKVFETAHTIIYKQQESGTDLTELNNIQMVEIHLEREHVEGGLSYFPENTLVVFYPKEDLAYTGKVFVDVIYNNDEILRTQFEVRPLPTLIEGFVTNQTLKPMEGIEVEIKELGRTTITNADGNYTFGYGDDVSRNIPGGVYTLIANKGFKNKNYGQIQIKENIQEGLLNSVDHLRLPVLNLQEPFRRIESGQAEAVLNRGNISLYLSETEFLFPDNRDKGDVHVQLLPKTRIPFQAVELAIPQFAYAFQPTGIEVSGNLKVKLFMPSFKGSYDYLDELGTRVILVGLDPDANMIVPMDVGLVDHNTKTIKSAEDSVSEFKCLDYIGYSTIPIEAQSLLDPVVSGEATMADVISVMESLK